MHLLADCIVFATEGDEFTELCLERSILLSERDYLPFGDRDGVAIVRMRHIDFRKQVGVLGEESRILLQIVRDYLGIHRLIPALDHHRALAIRLRTP